MQQGSYSSINITQLDISILDLIVTAMVNVALKTFVQLNNSHIPPMSFTFYIFKTMEEVSNESIVLCSFTFF